MFKDMGPAAIREAGIPGTDLRLDVGLYRSDGAEQCCFVVGAFLNDGTPVGFSSVILSRHNTDQTYAANDVIYVERAHRHTGAGAWLVRISEEEAKRRGAMSFLWSVGIDSPLDAAFHRRPSYKLFQRTFSKEL